MSSPIKPKRLQLGDRIGIVNPAYWLDSEKQARAVKAFEKLGYELVLGKSTELKEHRFAGTPQQRADDLMAMFADDSIDAIICARGGYGGNRVLPLLDYGIIQANPKIFVGYSDITGYLCSISQQSNLITFHGPMLSTFGKETIDYNIETLIQVLSGEDNLKLRSPKNCQARTLKPGIVRGPLWGGNLCLLVERLATDGQLNTEGCILFLEEIGEELYAFERQFLHLKNSGSLDAIKGLIIGEMVDITDNHETSFGKSINEIVLDICEGLDIPIITNFPCGHGDYQTTLPVSHSVELHADKNDPYILILDSPVS
ncbi:MAG: LD-carboxypeptidase [Kangiellaceae bacterium]|nr:LD-carboxypeptidase [Kangiellaceae bacterium]